MDNAIINYHIEMEKLLKEADESILFMKRRLEVLKKMVGEKWAKVNELEERLKEAEYKNKILENRVEVHDQSMIKTNVSESTYAIRMEELKEDNLNLKRSIRLKDTIITRLKKKNMDLEEELLKEKINN